MLINDAKSIFNRYSNRLLLNNLDVALFKFRLCSLRFIKILLSYLIIGLRSINSLKTLFIYLLVLYLIENSNLIYDGLHLILLMANLYLSYLACPK